MNFADDFRVYVKYALTNLTYDFTNFVNLTNTPIYAYCYKSSNSKYVLHQIIQKYLPGSAMGV